MKVRLLLALAGLAIGFAVPASMAQDAMKVVTADELVWKEHPVLKGAQIGQPLKCVRAMIGRRGWRHGT